MKGEERLAEQIAQTMQAWLAAGRIVARTGRPITAGDILVLVQRRGGLVEALVRACAASHVPTTGLDRLRLNTHLAVWDAIALLDICCDMTDDMALANVLLSPFGGMEYDALTRLCANRSPARPLCDALAECEEVFFARIHRWHSIAREMIIPSRVLAHILWQEGYMQYFIQRFGESVREILTTLIARCAAYETSTIAPTMQACVEWLRASHSEIKRDLEQTADKVRIMTVHGAKGLEAPIIILADAHALPRDKALFLPAPDASTVLTMQGAAHTHSGLFAEAKEAKRAESEAEYWRLLYVALTRACDELHIFGLQTTNQQRENWYDAVQSVMDASSHVTVHPDGVKEYRLHDEEEKATSIDMPEDRCMLPDFLTTPVPTQCASVLPMAVTSFIASIEGHGRGALWQPLWESELTPRMIGSFIHALLEKQAGMPFAVFMDKVAQLMPWVATQTNLRLSDADAEGMLTLLRHVAQSAECVALLEAPALAEISLTGEMQNISLIAQCDRVIIKDDRLHIIDIKVAAPPISAAAADSRYVAQLTAYKALLAAKFPSHEIITSLLYVHTTSTVMQVAA
jgi:ATP-dependent helicase/nuclease subunit A